MMITLGELDTQVKKVPMLEVINENSPGLEDASPSPEL